jgi:hypothetical protein
MFSQRAISIFLLQVYGLLAGAEPFWRQHRNQHASLSCCGQVLDLSVGSCHSPNAARRVVDRISAASGSIGVGAAPGHVNRLRAAGLPLAISSTQ